MFAPALQLTNQTIVSCITERLAIGLLIRQIHSLSQSDDLTSPEVISGNADQANGSMCVCFVGLSLWMIAVFVKCLGQHISAALNFTRH